MQNCSDNCHNTFELKSVVNTQKNETEFSASFEATSPIKNTMRDTNNVIPMPFINLSGVKVIKKDGTKEEYNITKVVNAVKKSAARMMITFSDDEIRKICELVNVKVSQNCDREVQIADIHNIVDSVLESVNPKVAQSYRNYRNYKQEFVSMLDKVYQESQKIMYIGDKENSNSDSALVSTKRSLVFNQ